MAGALGDTSMLEEELKCAVCLNFYREPHLLPCGHSFCLRCLRKLKSRSECGLRCPECRENHHRSTQWQKNFRLASIADGFRQCTRAQRHNQSRPGPSGYKTTEVCCDYCGPDIASNSGKKSTAVKTCLKCEVSMCPEHVQHHLELPAFRDHPLVEPLSDLKKRKCTEHDELFRYYCRDEHKFLCNACTIERGQSRHAIKTLKNTMKDLRVPLSSQWQNMNRKLKRVMKIEQEQREIEFQNKSFLEEIDRRLGILRGDLMTRLDGFMLSLSENVHQFELENSLKIQQQLSKTEEDRHHMEIVHARIEQLLQETDPFLFVKDYRSCAKSYRRLLKRPFFEPHTVPLHTEVIEENMAEKLEDFMIDLRQHIATFINTIFSRDAMDDDEGVEEEEEEEDEEEEEEEEEGEEDCSDENEEENFSSDENEEQEEDVSENDEEEEEEDDDDEYTESAYGYTPEEEEDE